MTKIPCLPSPHRSLLTPLLALLLAAQAPGCIRQYDDFVGAQDVASDNRADDGNPGDAGGGDVALDSAHTDVAEPKDTVHKDTVDVDICVPDCDGKACGDDGCGGSCGECTDCKSVCSEGQCEAQPQSDSGCFDNDIYWKDSCGDWGDKATECGGAGCNTGSKVCADCEEICGAYECGMQGDCDCGTCPSGQSCQAGQCEVKCGDGQCGAGEDKCSCPADCAGGCAGCCAGTECKTGDTVSFCGSGGEPCDECTGGEVCDGVGCDCTSEHHKGCAAGDVYWFDSCGVQGDKYEECGAHACADATCQSASCPDGFCNGTETQCSCAQDCGTCAGCCSGTTCKTGMAHTQCGKNGVTCQNCTADEESCVNQECKCDCGDGMCCDTETCCTCSSDCGSCCGNGQCDCGETYQTCPADCESSVQCSPSCDPVLEECVAVTTGGFKCTAKMVEVPAGNFWMGCNNCAGSTVNDTNCNSDEHPYHEVYLDTYEIDRTEVTASQYGACVSAGGCTAAGTGSYATYQVSGKENHPINYVNWGQVEAYCLWTGKELCTEAQWEKGARGGCEHNGGASNCKAQSRKYPWLGNAAPTCDLAVMSGCDGDTQAVCSKSPAGDSPYGLCDMAGNVWEWVADWFGSDYYCAGSGADTSSPWTYCPECGSWPGSPNAWNNPYCNISGSARVGRGGGFGSVYDYLRVSVRFYVDPSGSGYDLGGRCCRSE